MKINKLFLLVLLVFSFNVSASPSTPMEKKDTGFNIPKLSDVYLEGDLVSLNKGMFAQDVMTGASVNQQIYVKFEGKHNPNYNFGSEETIGFHQTFNMVTPYVEANYSYDGKEKFRDWKKNAGYDFGVKANITLLYLIGVESEDTFDNSKRAYKIEGSYNLTHNWTVGAYYQTKSQSAESAKLGLSARYNF